MRVEVRIPSKEQLLDAYSLIQNTKANLGENEIITLLQLTRFDPRLLEQLIVHISSHWHSISATRLNQENSNQAWPQTLAVCLEHSSIVVASEKKLFKNWLLITQ